MAIIELFSKKQKRLRGEVIDVYQYNTIPHPLRVQVVHILRDCIGQDDYGYTNVDDCYKFLVETLCREYGLFELVPYAHNNESALSDFLLKTKSTEQALDVIDLSFKYISRIINKKYDYSREARVNMTPDEAIKELNERFKEHGVGYQFEGELIRLDSTYMHSEVTIPTLTLLSSHTYEATNNEYLNAHEHYRHGRNGECLIKCNNAFEGTMKIICKKKGMALL